jgi:hypothetical protein
LLSPTSVIFAMILLASFRVDVLSCTFEALHESETPNSKP